MKLFVFAILTLSLLLAACAQADYNNVLVTKVFDGDTLQLASGEKVRLIGIDCPELYESDKLYSDARRTGQDIKTIQARGRAAYQFTRKLAEDRCVRLDFDIERRDKYGRLLAYVYVKSTEFNKEKNDYEYNKFSSRSIFLNKEIIKQGYAQPLAIPPNLRYADLFQNLYQETKDHKKGLWSE